MIAAIVQGIVTITKTVIDPFDNIVTVISRRLQ